MTKKLSTLFSLAGIKLDVLPGISIAFWPVYVILSQIRIPMLMAFHLQRAPDSVVEPVFGLLVVLCSVALWAISGFIFDPIYDHFYGPNGAWTRSPKPRLLIFPPAYDLDRFRTLARHKLAATNSVYSDPNISIYTPVMEALRTSDAELRSDVKTELQISKVFRNALLPGLILTGWFIYTRAYMIGILALLMVVVWAAISFRYRASHSTRAYRYYATQSV